MTLQELKDALASGKRVWIDGDPVTADGDGWYCWRGFTWGDRLDQILALAGDRVKVEAPPEPPAFVRSLFAGPSMHEDSTAISATVRGHFTEAQVRAALEGLQGKTGVVRTSADGIRVDDKWPSEWLLTYCQDGDTVMVVPSRAPAQGSKP